MKTLSYISFAFLLVTLNACNEKDNYDPPQVQITGAVLYQGDSIYLEQDRVPYQFYQYGFGKLAPIEQTFTQSGVISSLLFSGEYKFIVPNGQGPFLWPKTATGAPDSLTINLTGSQTLDIEVTPYYMIRSTDMSANGGNVTANFGVEKVVTDANAKDIENVTLYISKTSFVSGANNIASTSISGTDITDMNNISLSVGVPSITPAQNYVFGRVGLKIAGVEDMIFSPLFQLNY
jgi:hypothetical protein